MSDPLAHDRDPDTIEAASEEVGLPCLMPSCVRLRCAACHQLLPARHRDQIARAHIRGMTQETSTAGMRIAITAARAWILQAFGADPRDKEPGRWARLVRWVRAKDEARRSARAAGIPITIPRCPAPECPCPECTVEHGAPG